MRQKMIALAAAAVATAAVATSAQAGQWVYIPDNDAPQAYVSSRTYVEPGTTYVPAQRRVYRQVTPATPAPGTGLYIQTDTAVNDGCTYHRERGLFGGWEETRYCPD